MFWVWEDVELNADLSQTQLYTDKASVGLSHKDTLYVNTNALDFTVDYPTGGWITSVRKIADNGSRLRLTWTLTWMANLVVLISRSKRIT